MSTQRRTVSFPTWFKRYIAQYKRSVAVALGLGALAAGCAALLMFTSGYLISATAQEGTVLFAILLPVACVQLFGAGRPFARYIERLVSHDWVLRITSHLRLNLFWGIEKRIDDPAKKRATGEYLGLLSDDVAHLQNLYLRVVFPATIALLLAVGASITFGFFSVPFALIMLLIFLGTAGLLPYASLIVTRGHAERAKALRAQEFAMLTDDIMGATDWVLAGRGQETAQAHARRDAEIRAVEARTRLTERALSLLASLILGAAVCLVIAWSAGRFDASPTTANWIAAFALGFFPLIESFAMLPGAWTQIPVHADSITRLDEYVDAPSALRAALPQTADADLPPTPSSGELADPAIQIDDVSYTYPDSATPVLEHISIDIAANSNVAILGRSGSGKSTLAEIIRGALAPSSGKIATNGKSADQPLEPGAVAVGYLGQSPHLFNRTLRDNLTLGVTEISDSKLERILEEVGLGERLSALPDGLDTVIGETGIGFSGGEAHRIALARVLVVDAPIVLVDEPFAALDSDTERELLDALFDTCVHKTLVVITHHLAQIERFDRVLFIEDGHVDLDGTPAELSATSARFRRLVAFDRS